ncbi:MAG TPA: glycosyltransferase family 1 protein, partial [Bacteroidales bacterium]|nr:glycosyltransferase family 1 protein [Bacteroidales bacterium]
SAHSLSLNITELRNTYVLKKPIHKLHLRTFEIPMAGGLEFTSYTPEILNYFEPDKEIVLYDSDEEMTEKARFYLDPKNEYLCKIMKKNARKRSVSEHTWKNRF